MKKILLLAVAAVMTATAGCSNSSSLSADIPETIRIGSLKGPTSMGIVNMKYENYLGDLSSLCNYYMAVQADELAGKMIKSELDIALVPANLASVLYNKTEGKVSVIDINTLGVLYVVEEGDSIKEVSDLEGKTIYMTGKGTTPDYVLQYLLDKNSIAVSDVTIEYKSEAAEVLSQLESDEEAVGLLPQPFVTTALMNNDKLHIALDLTKEWEKVSDSSLITGVTVVRNEFLEKYPDVVKKFVDGHAASVELSKSDVDLTCKRIEEMGIIKEAVAKKAIDYCNLVCITGDEMKKDLKGLLEVYYSFNPQMLGGTLPGDDFYADID